MGLTPSVRIILAYYDILSEGQKQCALLLYFYNKPTIYLKYILLWKSWLSFRILASIMIGFATISKYDGYQIIHTC